MPVAGEKPRIIGATRNPLVDVAWPSGVTRVKPPVVAPAGMTTRSEVAVTVAGVARTPPWKITSVAPRNPRPLIVTVVPTEPVTGVKLVRTGTSALAAGATNSPLIRQIAVAHNSGATSPRKICPIVPRNEIRLQGANTGLKGDGQYGRQVNEVASGTAARAVIFSDSRYLRRAETS